MVFLNPALAKTSGGIQAKSNWIKNMVGGALDGMTLLFSLKLLLLIDI